MTSDRSSRTRRRIIDRRKFLAAASAAGVAGIAGCSGGGDGGDGGGGDMTTTTTSQSGSGGGTTATTTTSSGSKQEIMDKFDLQMPDYADEIEDSLTVFQWSSYWPTYFVPNFEEVFGVSVEVSYFDSNEAMFNKLKTIGGGEVDLIFPSDFMVNVMATQGYLRPLDKGMVPNWDNYKEKFKHPGYEPEADKSYSAPWEWGMSAIANNKNVSGRALDPTWDEMWNEEFKGDITMLNNVREAFSAALFRLGYDNNTTDQDKINEAKDALIEQKPLLKGYTSNNVQSFLENGEASPCHAWTGQAMTPYKDLLKDGESPVEYVFPKEGNVIWTDAMTITKDAKHPNAAYAFINYSLNTKVHADLSEWLVYPTVLKDEAKYRSDSEMLKQPAIDPSPDLLENMHYINNVGDATKYYSQAWTEVKNA